MKSQPRQPKRSAANKKSYRSEQGNLDAAAPLPVRFLAHGLLFGEEALTYDTQPEASAFISDAEVAELLKKTGNVACHPEWLGQIRSIITAFSELREAQARWPEDSTWPDERISRAVGVLQSAIPAQIERLYYQIQTMPVEFHDRRKMEIARLEHILTATAEKPHLPLEKEYEGRVDVKTMVTLLSKICDNIFGPGRYWKKSPKTLFVAAAVRKAGWEVSAGAIEQQTLYAQRSGRTRK